MAPEVFPPRYEIKTIHFSRVQNTLAGQKIEISLFPYCLQKYIYFDFPCTNPRYAKVAVAGCLYTRVIVFVKISWKSPNITIFRHSENLLV